MTRTGALFEAGKQRFDSQDCDAVSIAEIAKCSEGRVIVNSRSITNRRHFIGGNILLDQDAGRIGSELWV